MPDSDLLKPSLSAESLQAPIYSVGALIATAFFGGMFAVPLLAAENARLQRRLVRDLPWLVLGFAVGGVAFYLAYLYSAGGDQADLRYLVRMVSRGVGFLFVGGYYVLHRRAYRTMSTMGIEPPSPYVAVIACVLVSYALVIGIAALLPPLTGSR